MCHLIYSSGVLPGIATVHKGIVLTERNLFAGFEPAPTAVYPRLFAGRRFGANLHSLSKIHSERVMSDFVFLPGIEEYYLKGMYWTAMEGKENVE